MRRNTAQNGSVSITLVVLCVLAIIGLVLWSIVGLRLWARHSRNTQYQADAQALLESARAWRENNNANWPEQCLIEPGTQRLCPTGKDRDAILAASSPLSSDYELFVVDTAL